MAISVFDLFKIGIGPSSSHTVGPMRAAALFVQALGERRLLARVTRVEVKLYGSLSATGVGHGTDNAVIMGLMGEWPDRIDPRQIAPRIAALKETGSLLLAILRHASLNMTVVVATAAWAAFPMAWMMTLLWLVALLLVARFGPARLTTCLSTRHPPPSPQHPVPSTS